MNYMRRESTATEVGAICLIALAMIGVFAYGVISMNSAGVEASPPADAPGCTAAGEATVCEYEVQRPMAVQYTCIIVIGNRGTFESRSPDVAISCNW